MVGPTDEVILLTREEMVARSMELVFRVSRIVVSEFERSEVSIVDG